MNRTRRGVISRPAAILAFAVLEFVVASHAALAQGTVTFANTGTFVTVADRRVYDPVTCAPLVGTNWVAALYFGFNENSINSLAVRSLEDHTLLSATARFRDVDVSSPAAGTWSGGNRTLLDVTIGQTVLMQVRVWDLSKFATFDEAEVSGGYALESAPFSYLVPGALDAYGLKMDNFRGITPPECVPEPSVFILVGLGLVILIARRHRKVDQASVDAAASNPR